MSATVRSLIIPPTDAWNLNDLQADLDLRLEEHNNQRSQEILLRQNTKATLFVALPSAKEKLLHDLPAA